MRSDQQDPLETVAEASVAAPASSSSSPKAASIGGRTTVLPRRSGGAAELKMAEEPRFEQLGPLGEGGIGEVVLVRDRDISRHVALKRLKPGQRNDAALVRLAEEVRIVGQLEHPGIVPIHDVGIDDEGQHYLLMRYVEGETLEHIIDRLREGDPHAVERFSFSYRLQIFASILEAVSYAHDKGIIHRDLKPANIMIGPHGEVTIMDWGIAKRMGSDDAGCDEQGALAATLQDRLVQTQHGAVVGTPLYMSPEQAAGKSAALDARSDIFSLGLVFYELMSLKHPLEHKESVNEIIAELIAKPIDLPVAHQHARAAKMPLEFFSVLARALQHDPAERYASAQEMLEHIRSVQDGHVAVQCHVTAFKHLAYTAAHWVDRNPERYTVGLLLLAASIVGAIGYGLFRLLA